MITSSSTLRSNVPPAEASKRIAASPVFKGEVSGNAFTLRRVADPTWNAKDRDGSWARVHGRIEPDGDGSAISLKFALAWEMAALTAAILGGTALAILASTGGTPLVNPLHLVWVLIALVVVPFAVGGFRFDARKSEKVLQSVLDGTNAPAPHAAAPPASAGRKALGAIVAIAGGAVMFYGISLATTVASAVLGLVLAAVGVILVAFGVSSLLFRG